MSELLGGRLLVSGEGEGFAAVIDPISLWGGVDPVSGIVIDPRHAALGMRLTKRIVVMRHGAGSSSSASVLAELIRNEAAPAGMVLESPDPIVVIGSLVAAELYEKLCPVVLLAEATLRIPDGARVAISEVGVSLA